MADPFSIKNSDSRLKALSLNILIICYLSNKICFKKNK